MPPSPAMTTQRRMVTTRDALRHVSQRCSSSSSSIKTLSRSPAPTPTSNPTSYIRARTFGSLCTRCHGTRKLNHAVPSRHMSSSSSLLSNKYSRHNVPSSLSPSSSSPSPLISTIYSCKRNFGVTSHRSVQPSPSPDNDPQNSATPRLPDITNYYTLFPTTLSNGPPGPGPREEMPSSRSSIVSSDTASASSPSTGTSTGTFTIHIPTLRKEFLRLQSLHHPDKYASNKSAHQKALALSAFINAAYKTLADPLLRAQYLLQLQYGIDVTSEDNAAHPTDQDTLMEVMEAQERVEAASVQDDIDGIRRENVERIVRTEKLMGQAFEMGDAQNAKEECVRLKYWRSLQGALDEWQPGQEVRLIH